jgi:uncharacterized protein
VAFQVDDIDSRLRSGWSVVLTGVASPVEAFGDLLRVQQPGLAPWAPGQRDHDVRIAPGLISGRHLVSSAALT